MMKTSNFIRINILMILLIMLIFIACPCLEPFTESATVRGIVSDLSNNPIADVEVTLNESITYTNDVGQFEFLDVAEGNDLLLYFSKSGYADNQKLVDVKVDESSYVFAALGKWNTIKTIDPSTANDRNFPKCFSQPSCKRNRRSEWQCIYGGCRPKSCLFRPDVPKLRRGLPGEF
jgi:hypothetical protein